MSFLPDSIKCIAVVSPAGPPDREKLAKGIAFLEENGLKVKNYTGNSGADSSFGYLSASDRERAASFTAAYLDEEVDMIFSSRGGYGCARMIPYLDWEKLKQRNIPVAGYSDLTSLFFAMVSNNCGTPIASIMASELAFCTRRELDGIYAACSNQKRVFDLKVVKPGKGSGTILAGNLTVAASCAGTSQMPSARGKILLLEDVGEAPYRIDRSLNQLAQCGMLSECTGLVCGYFSGASDPEVQQIISHYSKFVNGPVLSGFAYGHELPFDAVSFSQNAEIENNLLTLQ